MGQRTMLRNTVQEESTTSGTWGWGRVNKSEDALSSPSMLIFWPSCRGQTATTGTYRLSLTKKLARILSQRCPEEQPAGWQRNSIASSAVWHWVIRIAHRWWRNSLDSAVVLKLIHKESVLGSWETPWWMDWSWSKGMIH